jgi:hypothetical protein
MPLKVRVAGPAVLTSLAFALTLAMLGVIGFSDSPALAANVSCGDMITTDTTLHKDLNNCPTTAS